MEGNREGKRPPGDFLGFEPRAVDPVDDPSEDEFLAEKQAVVDRRMLEVDATCPPEVRAEGAFQRAHVEIRVETARSYPERPPREVCRTSVLPDRLEVSRDEFLACQVSQPEPQKRPFHGTARIEPQDPAPERRLADVDPLRRHRGEGLRPRQGRVFAGELDHDAHVRRLRREAMSLPATVTLKWS